MVQEPRFFDVDSNEIDRYARAIARILERGVRADQSTPGHGIGMAIVRDIMQVYGGELSIENHSEGGACMTIRIKRSK